MQALEIRDLSFSHENRIEHALYHINLDVRNNELVIESRLFVSSEIAIDYSANSDVVQVTPL